MGPNKQDENALRINREITAPEVRLVGENIPEQGIYPIVKALAMAQELELDLVDINYLTCSRIITIVT